MRRLAVIAALSALGLFAGCATTPPPPPPPPPPAPGAPVLLDWNAVIRPADRVRLDGLSAAWRDGLAEARAAGHAAELADLSPLTDPDAGQIRAKPEPGDYKCRTVKLGSQAEGGLSYVAYGWFDCRIESTPKGLKFSKLTGSQRPAGLLFPDTDRRMVLLGSLSLGDEPPARSYGLNPDRDVVAVFERLKGGGFRLAFPRPAVESDLDLIELRRAP